MGSGIGRAGGSVGWAVSAGNVVAAFAGRDEGALNKPAAWAWGNRKGATKASAWKTGR
jgi:hypothetical protein